MRMLLTLVLLVGFLMVGCQDDNSILEPSVSQEESTLSKRTAILPENEVRSFYSKTYTINGTRGGKIREKHVWIDDNGNKITMAAVLWIPRGAFEGDLTFDVNFDLENLSVDLAPSPFTFNVPVHLDLEFWGMDISDISPDQTSFKYLAADGSVEDVNCENLIVDTDQKYLAVWWGELHHFSRYGWTRTK